MLAEGSLLRSDRRINAIHNQGAFIGCAQLAGEGCRRSAEDAGVDQLAGDFHTVLHAEPEEILLLRPDKNA